MSPPDYQAGSSSLRCDFYLASTHMHTGTDCLPACLRTDFKMYYRNPQRLHDALKMLCKAALLQNTLPLATLNSVYCDPIHCGRVTFSQYKSDV